MFGLPCIWCPLPDSGDGFANGRSIDTSSQKGDPVPKRHSWQFRPRFHRRAFGWRSQPAVKRVREAVAEIRKVARRDPVLGAEGAVLFLEKVSPALEQVDSSSGTIGTAVNKAIEVLAPIISSAPLDRAQREGLLERLFQAFQDEEIPYIDTLGDYWGDLCGGPELASEWADRLVGIVKLSWSPDPNLRGYFKGTVACLSAFLAAGRHQELLNLLETAPANSWDFRAYGVRALTALGRKADALGRREEVRERIRALVAAEPPGQRFVNQILGRTLGLE